MTTAQELIDELLKIRSQKEDLESQEAWIKEQLQGALALGELDSFETDQGIYEFPNAKYSRCERNTYKYSKEAEKAISAIKQKDIDSGLASRNMTIYYQLRINNWTTALRSPSAVYPRHKAQKNTSDGV